MLGRIEKIVRINSDIISTKLIPSDTAGIEAKPPHRIVRNIFFVGFVLLLVALSSQHCRY